MVLKDCQGPSPRSSCRRGRAEGMHTGEHPSPALARGERCGISRAGPLRLRMRRPSHRGREKVVGSSASCQPLLARLLLFEIKRLWAATWLGTACLLLNALQPGHRVWSDWKRMNLVGGEKHNTPQDREVTQQQPAGPGRSACKHSQKAHGRPSKTPTEPSSSRKCAQPQPHQTHPRRTRGWRWGRAAGDGNHGMLLVSPPVIRSDPQT